MRSIFFNFNFSGLSRALINILGLFIVSLMTRQLGPDGFGYYSTVMAYIFLFSVLADFGLQLILVRDISKPNANESDIVGSLIVMRLLGAVLSSLLAIGLLYFISYSEVVEQGIFFATGFLILSSLVQVVMGVFQKHLQLYWVAISDFIARALQLGIVWILVMTGIDTLLPYIITIVVVEVVHFVMIIFFTYRIVPFRLHIDISYWKLVLNQSIPIAVSFVFTLLYFRIDTIFLSLMRSAHEVGMYSVAYKVLEVIIFIPALYTGLILPYLSKHNNNKLIFDMYMQKTMILLVILALPMAGFVFVLAPKIIGLIGGEVFAQSITLLQILVPGIVMIFFGNLAGRALIAFDLQRIGMWIYGFGALINIIANIVLIPKFGALGAAWTTVGTEVIVTLLLFFAISGRTEATVNTVQSLRIITSNLLMVVIWWLFKDNFVLAFVSSIFYIPLLFFVGGISIGDLRLLINQQEADISNHYAGQ